MAEDGGTTTSVTSPWSLLADAAHVLHGAGPLDVALTWFTEAARQLAGASAALYVRIEDGAAPVGAGSTPPEAIAALAAFIRGIPDDETIVRLDEADPSGSLASTSHLVVPVRHATGRLHGGLVLSHPDPDRFDPDEAGAVRALATHLGIALDNRATMEQLAELEATQREAVHALQEAVRPPMPTVNATELGVHYVPAEERSPTGGDLYDWILLPDGDLHLVVVDVMGKGVAATKDALAVTHALRMLALDGCPLDRIVVRADALVTAQSPDLVATLIVARYSPTTGVVRLVGAGHPPAMVVGADGTVRQVPAAGIAIGWPGAGSAEVATLTMGRSETLVLYTDGLIEARRDIIVGLASLEHAAAETTRYPAPAMARALVDRALHGAERRDDSLAVVLRRRTPPVSPTVSGLGPLEYRFSPNVVAVPLARGFLDDWLRHQPVDDQERADLLLVASELCSNAVRHASGAAASVCLRAWAEGDALVLEVEDDGGKPFTLPKLHDEEVPDRDLERGRGLYLVRALADEITVDARDGRTTVRVVRRALLG
jgi:serine phosphatase RsbU (regulator of sigma subunit)/anti-sigma regulatory factor (Ser/Thr protein kinase)